MSKVRLASVNAVGQRMRGLRLGVPVVIRWTLGDEIIATPQEGLRRAQVSITPHCRFPAHLHQTINVNVALFFAAIAHLMTAGRRFLLVDDGASFGCLMLPIMANDAWYRGY
jgi:hypothetical protein